MLAKRKSALKLNHINALNQFAIIYGARWRSRLRKLAENPGSVPLRTSVRDGQLLGELLQLIPLDTLLEFRPQVGGFKSVGYLVKEKVVQMNDTRHWSVNAYRITDFRNEDHITPWPRTKTEAREKANKRGIFLVEHLM